MTDAAQDQLPLQRHASGNAGEGEAQTGQAGSGQVVHATPALGGLAVSSTVRRQPAPATPGQDTVLPALRRQAAAQPAGSGEPVVIHRLFDFSKWFGKKKKKGKAKADGGTDTGATTETTPESTPQEETSTKVEPKPEAKPWAKAEPNKKNIDLTGAPIVGTNRETPESDGPMQGPKTAHDSLLEMIGDGAAPKDAKEAIARLSAARTLIASMPAEDKKKLADDAGFKAKAMSFVTIRGYGSLLAALGIKNTRKADKKKGVKATVNHMSGAEADSFIQQNMGAIAHLKGYVKTALSAGKQADGFIAVVDTDDWNKLYEEEFPSEPIGSDDEVYTNAFVSNGPDEPAIIHSDRGTRSTAIHESMHRYSASDLNINYGFNLNEGVTEYFTRRITDKNGEPVAKGGPSRDNYGKNFSFVQALLPMLGKNLVERETTLAEVYFSGKVDKMKECFAAAWTAKKAKQDDIDKKWKELTKNVKSGKWADAQSLLP